MEQLIKEAVGQTTEETIDKLTFLINELRCESIDFASDNFDKWFYKLSKLCEARKIEQTSLLPRPLFPIGTKIVVDDQYNPKHGIVGTIICYLDYNDPRRIMVQISPDLSNPIKGDQSLGSINEYNFEIDIRLTKQK